MPNDALIKFIKQQYPPGTRIRLDAMNDPYNPIAPGTLGKVNFVDDAGQIHMKWDNGSGLALIPGEDRFSVVKPELRPLKLYMPLHADLYERNEYGDLEEYPNELDGRYLTEYKDAILAAKLLGKVALHQYFEILKHTVCLVEFIHRHLQANAALLLQGLAQTSAELCVCDIVSYNQHTVSFFK
jgi:hypothetical protein